MALLRRLVRFFRGSRCTAHNPLVSPQSYQPWWAKR